MYYIVFLKKKLKCSSLLVLLKHSNIKSRFFLKKLLYAKHEIYASLHYCFLIPFQELSLIHPISYFSACCVFLCRRTKIYFSVGIAFSFNKKYNTTRQNKNKAFSRKLSSCKFACAHLI